MILILFCIIVFYIIGVSQIIDYEKRSFINRVYVIFLHLCFATYYVVIKLFTTGISNNTTCLVGKTAIVTGGNAGIGLEVAKLLASRGCTVIIADKDDAQKSKQIIVEETGNSNIIVKHLDLSSFRSVRAFAKDICATVERLDILINNAGVGGSLAKRTEDGLDLTMQVNHFGPFLLTHLLVELLKKSAPSRIIFATSCLAFQHHFSTDDLKFSEQPNDHYARAVLRYSHSKLCNIITADYFAKELSGTGVTANCADPGSVKTEIFRKSVSNFPSIVKSILNSSTSACIGRSPYVGAQTMFHLATSKELANVSGKNFYNCKPFLKPNIVLKAELCKEVWEISEESVKLELNEKLHNNFKK